MDIHFDNQAVIVTGAARGIGGGIVEGFVERGARVWACDVLEDELSALKARAKPQRGGTLETRKVDLTQSRQVDAFVREVEQACGGVDVLVHVAGGVRGQSKRPVEEVSDDDWRAIQAVNVEGAFFASRAVAPGMKKKAAGRIVVIASRAGLGVSLTGIQSYATAKAAQLGLVRQLAHELGPQRHHGQRRGAGLSAHQPRLRAAMAVLRAGGPEGDDRARRHAPPGRAAGHRPCRDVSGLALCVVDHRPGAAGDGESDFMTRSSVIPTRSLAKRGGVEGPVLHERRQNRSPRLRRPAGGSARDDG